MSAFEDIPGRVFLDTCVVNFILDHGGQIHEGEPIPKELPEADVRDVEALANIFLTGQRAGWQLAISPFTYYEVLKTRDATRRGELGNWLNELWAAWRYTIDHSDDLPTFVEAEHSRALVLASPILAQLPDVADRVLLCDAYVYRCDYFCTRDIATIVRNRSSIVELPVRIGTPAEWWELIRPYATLW